MEIKIDEIQKKFINTACNLAWAIFQFSITDKDFEEDYGFTKEEAHKAIIELRRELKK